ncbi:hypothetical protein M2105_000058 [Paenibacillus sp. PastF-1]|nr:hypothetical protein [Paenibacillus sp. PastF-2]MDF9845644.1 hypothetical protein [Paenibacillus sp. PastM-2]MDF9852216.1 hypothetical protein [Paenibacillus sp. PastF-1]MDH6478055.1 hypothetical protein [Paenibacillus sp. PastH-2]MDH6505790.1 hypothetical protein [Paenibacillus sp. PastM-3]
MKEPSFTQRKFENCDRESMKEYKLGKWKRMLSRTKEKRGGHARENSLKREFPTGDSKINDKTCNIGLTERQSQADC